MSHSATLWSYKQKFTRTPAQTLILQYLAYRHNDDLDMAFVSLSTIAEDCNLDRATVCRTLAALCDPDGLDLVEKVGRTAGGVNQYRVKWQTFTVENNGSAGSCRMQPGGLQDATRVVAGCDQPLIKQSKAKKTKKRASAREVVFSETPEGVSPEVWQRWEKHRHELRGSKWTRAARDAQLRELDTLRAAGHNLDECLQSAMASNWTACKAQYFRDKSGKAPQPLKERKLYGRGRDELFREYINDRLPESISRVVSEAVPDVHALRMAAERDAWRLWNSEVWPKLLAF